MWLLTATAAVATMGDAKAFKSGREFAAWLGLVPGKAAQAGESNCSVSASLIHGARSVLSHSKEPPQLVTNLAQRRLQNVVVVALANKMARTIWALPAHERAYRKGT